MDEAGADQAEMAGEQQARAEEPEAGEQTRRDSTNNRSTGTETVLRFEFTTSEPLTKETVNDIVENRLASFAGMEEAQLPIQNVEITVRSVGTGKRFCVTRRSGHRRLADTGYEMIIKFLTPEKSAVDSIVAHFNEVVKAVAGDLGWTINLLTPKRRARKNTQIPSKDVKSSKWKLKQYMTFIAAPAGGAVLLLVLLCCWCNKNEKEKGNLRRAIVHRRRPVSDYSEDEFSEEAEDLEMGREQPQPKPVRELVRVYDIENPKPKAKQAKPNAEKGPAPKKKGNLWNIMKAQQARIKKVPAPEKAKKKKEKKRAKEREIPEEGQTRQSREKEPRAER